MSQSGRTQLVRGIGPWSLAALMVNGTIGSGIFGLPSKAAALTGQKSPLAFLIAAAGIAVIAACFAEVASYFRESGGPYLYTKATFGRFAGLGAGWMNWLSRLAGGAASANLFASYLGEFWPQLKGPFRRLAVITLLLGGLIAVNIRGIKLGTVVSNLLTVSKLVPLAVFVLGGCLFLAFHTGLPPVVSVRPSLDAWLSCTLLMVFAYSGWEAALTPAGEAKQPDRDAPIAILGALGICTPIYVLIQFVVVKTLANPAASESPLSASAAVFGGHALATMIALAVLVSTLGFLAGGMIATPRLLFAFAEQGDLPPWFAAVHPRYLTPHVSILTFGALLWLLAMLGNFSWNAKLSAVSRLITYGMTCAALPALRLKKPGFAKFRLPLGRFFAVLGVSFCVLVFSRAGRGELIVLWIVLAIALLNWIAVRWRSTVNAPCSDTEKDYRGHVDEKHCC